MLKEETTGIFESLRAYEGILFGLEEHLDRFFESAKTLAIKIPETRAEIKKRIRKALAEFGKKDAFIRLTLIKEGETYELPLLSVIVTERRHPPEIYQKGVSLRTTAVRRSLSQAVFPEAKSTEFLNQILTILEPNPQADYESLFLNAQGYLTEARIGNIFMVKEGRLFTPPPQGILNGVTRRFVIKCARLGKIPVKEQPLTRHELFNAEEAFLTNTSWEILPLSKVDGRRIGGEIPGPVTRRLQTLFRREVRKEISATKRGGRNQQTKVKS